MRTTRGSEDKVGSSPAVASRISSAAFQRGSQTLSLSIYETYLTDQRGRFRLHIGGLGFEATDLDPPHRTPPGPLSSPSNHLCNSPPHVEDEERHREP
jgi:hypothetical protein